MARTPDLTDLVTSSLDRQFGWGKTFVPARLRPGKIFFLAEAPGESEELLGEPLIGASGQLLRELCEIKDLSINIDECSKSNVFRLKPAGNKLEWFQVPRLVWQRDSKIYGPQMPMFRSGEYFDPLLVGPSIDLIWHELDSVRPNIIVALGAVALWALTGTSKITKYRGTTISTASFHPDRTPYKLLATYHPAALFRDWSKRPIVITDLMKAKRESAFPEVRRPGRQIWINPTLADLDIFERLYMQNLSLLSFDTETKNGQVTCISFAPDKRRAIVVPFASATKPGRSYWPTTVEERRAWAWVGKWLSSPIPKLAQNGVYDYQYCTFTGWRVVNLLHDTMLLHHSIYSEMPKALDFLGSCHTDEAPWKLMRPRGEDAFKKEE